MGLIYVLNNESLKTLRYETRKISMQHSQANQA